MLKNAILRRKQGGPLASSCATVCWDAMTCWLTYRPCLLFSVKGIVNHIDSSSVNPMMARGGVFFDSYLPALFFPWVVGFKRGC